MYGAMRGERGGFITLGPALEVAQDFDQLWSYHAGLFVGAGGGHGANDLAGGGLMIREDAGVSFSLSSAGRFGFGWSHVHFPSGSIASTQPYFQYEYQFYSAYHSGWSTLAMEDASSGVETASSQTEEIAATMHRYFLRENSPGYRSDAKGSSMHLLGIGWTSYLNDQWFANVESAGAVGGNSNGYMQVLAGGGYRFRLGRYSGMKLFASAGPAGGGGIDTGGGLLFKAGVSVSQTIVRKTGVEISVSQLRAPSGVFSARGIAAKLNYQFDTPVVSEGDVPLNVFSEFEPRKLRIRFVNQSYFKASDRWRNQYVDRTVSNLGVQLDYFFSPSSFVTGQGLAAYAGDAGAYMTGQLGVGRRWSLSDRWFAEGEGLIGAAGGGGLEVGGGLVGQANASLGYQVSNMFSVITSVGHIQAWRGPFKANVVGLSLAYQFTAYAR